MGNIQCGNTLTEPCLGETDIRYDSEASDNFVDQSIVWKKMAGYFKTEHYYYRGNYTPWETIDAPAFSLTLKLFPSPGYENFTIDGTRIYQHNYVFFENAIEGGLSLVRYTDSSKHTSYEKDGSAIVLPYLTSFSDFTTEQEIPSSVAYPVGNNSLLATGYSDSVFGLNDEGYTTWIETKTCLDESCDNMAVTVENFVNETRVLQILGTQTRISEEEFIEGMNQGYVGYNVVPSMQVPIPMEASCNNVDQCITEEEWCESGDPSCSESPYQEPDGKVKSGVIAGFTVAGFVVLLAILYLVHAYMVKKRDERNRVKFASRVAQTMSIRKSARSLSPALLEKEFNKIDKEHGGRITKEALREFLESGKAGEINDRDFEALWAVMHSDSSDTVDFLEFCAYMAQCQDEYNAAARANRGSIAVAASMARMSVARSLSVKVATEELKDLEAEEEGKDDTA